jgi:hypothetical protein
LSAGAWLALLAACSFEPSPLVSSSAPRASSPSSSGSAGTGLPDPPSSSGSGAIGSAGTGSPPSVSPPAGEGGATAPLGGSVAEAPPDAGTDGADEPLDAGGDDEPDAGTPDEECDEIPECVCAHERLEKPSDPCAAPNCPLDECAPDDDCELKRFESSVYYLCSVPHSQQEAEDHCEEIDDMHLVYIDGEDEDAFLDDEISGKVWIGATVDDEGEWSWGDGTAFYDEEGEEPIDDAYVDWDEDTDEPNGLGVGPGEATCAILWEETGAWADTNCPAMNGYVCEREL